jgi:hypothetical protein
VHLSGEDRMKITKEMIVENLKKKKETNQIKITSALFPNQFFEEGVPRRGILPKDTAVITATDQGFVNGAYLLAWTVLNSTDTDFICYDIGITDLNLKRQMASWGVEFSFMRPPIPNTHNGWQTLNKPWYIYHALQTYKNVLWLDADVWVYGSNTLVEMLNITKSGFFIPDHGIHCPATNRNDSKIYNFLPAPKIEWGERADNYWPCAGVIGCCDRDLELIKEWKDRLLILERNGVIDGLPWFDQGIIQDIIDFELQDGYIWNNLNAHRNGDPSLIFSQSYNGFAKIYHAGGEIKPWRDWQNLSWPNPNILSWKQEYFK